MKLDSSVRLSVAFLYAEDFDDSGAPVKKPFGSCFFVYANTPRHGVIFYLITAKHVLEAMRAGVGSMYVRLNRREERGVYYHALPRDGWHEHEDSSVDVAVLEIRPPFAKGTSAQLLAVDLNAVLAAPDAVSKLGQQWPPREGEEVCVVALFLQHQGQERNYPVFRFGHISLMSDEPLAGEYGPSEYYLIETQAYFGNSGAPVFVHHGDLPMYLLGVLSAAYPSEEEIRLAADGVHKYYNLGISKVVPIQKVADILNQEDLREPREEAGAR